MTSLYNISVSDRQMIEQMLEDGHDEKTIADTLEGESDFEGKLQATCAYRAGLLARAKGKREEAQRLIDAAISEEKQAERLDDYMLTCLNIRGQKKVSLPLFTVSIRPSTATVIENQNDIPRDYQRYVPPVPEGYVPDKALIKKAISDGFTVPGARLEHRQSISVK